MGYKLIKTFGPLIPDEIKQIKRLYKGGHGYLLISAVLGRRAKQIHDFIERIKNKEKEDEKYE